LDRAVASFLLRATAQIQDRDAPILEELNAEPDRDGGVRAALRQGHVEDRVSGVRSRAEEVQGHDAALSLVSDDERTWATSV